MRIFLLGCLCFVITELSYASYPSLEDPPGTGELGGPKKPKAPDKHDNSAENQRGTEKSPIIVQIAPSPNTEEDAAAAKQEKIEKASTERRSETLNFILAASAFIQAVALVCTIIVMIRTSRRQLRAYLFPEHASLCDGMMLTPPQPGHANEPGVVLTFKNSGETPAYNVTSWGQIEVIEPINEHRLNMPRHLVQFSSSLGSEGTMSKALWFGRPLTPNEIQEIGIGIRAIYLHGRIEYRDAFRGKRYSNFRVAYNGIFPPPPGVIFLFCEHGNEAN